MPYKIIRNDITKMHVECIVNTANPCPAIGDGCDSAIYHAAGSSELLAYRNALGKFEECDVFLTPGFALDCQYILHVVSPYFEGEQTNALIHQCYHNAFQVIEENNIKSVAFPLISTGSYRCPKEIGFRIALEEIQMFTSQHDVMVYLVVFDQESTKISKQIAAHLEEYITDYYVEDALLEEYCYAMPASVKGSIPDSLEERLMHTSDTFSEYLLYLISLKGLSYPEVYKNALVDKKLFSKIKNGSHPGKIVAQCLCVGAHLNLDEAKDLLSRAGYAFSPSDKTDIIFQYFIENEIYDMIEIDIQLEEHGLPYIIK